jgi:putative DNA primase/helicase
MRGAICNLNRSTMATAFGTHAHPNTLNGAAVHQVEDVHLAIDLVIEPDQIARHLRLLDADADAFIFASFDDDKERAKETARIRKEVDEGKLPTSALVGRILPEQRHGTIEQHYNWVEERQGQGAGLFVTVQSMTGERRLKNELAGIRAVFGELDHGTPDHWPLEPSFIVETSTEHYHPYWLIDPEHPLLPFDFTAIMMRLIETYGSDPDAKDLARVLRLAGTWNLKAGRRSHLVGVVHESGCRYTRAELLAAFPPPAPRPSLARQVGPRPKFNSRLAPGLERFTEPMNAIPADQYGEWIRVGQGLHWESGASAEGLRMWDAWSASSDKWHPGVCEDKWKSFRGSGVTGGTIFALAQQHGYYHKAQRSNGRADPIERVADARESAGGTGHGRALVSMRASEITPERVEWLWPGRIAVGKQTCIGGDPGTSKSTLSVAIAAAVTKGEKWPCGEGKAPVGSVIVLSAEDGAADTIVPRLLAAGADLSRVRIVTAVRMEDGKGRRSFNLQADLDLLEAHIKELGDAVLIIIDPVSSYMGKGDSHKNTEVRQVLEPVGEMATRMKVAVLTITHFSKSSNGGTTKALHRFIGSIAFIGAARAGFAVMEDPEDKSRRLFLHAKNNLAQPPQGLAYRLEERIAVPAKDHAEPIYASAIVWDGEPVGQTADDVLANAAGKGGSDSGKETAMAFLRQVLARGRVLAKEVLKIGAEDGLTPKTIRTAKEALGVLSEREGFGPGSKLWWSLPGPRSTTQDSVIDAQTSIDAPVLEQGIYASKGIYDDQV